MKIILLMISFLIKVHRIFINNFYPPRSRLVLILGYPGALLSKFIVHLFLLLLIDPDFFISLLDDLEE